MQVIASNEYYYTSSFQEVERTLNICYKRGIKFIQDQKRFSAFNAHAIRKFDFCFHDFYNVVINFQNTSGFKHLSSNIIKIYGSFFIQQWETKAK